jgi:hypothetical protein
MEELLAEFLRGFTATNNWGAILPEILLAVLALGLLVAEILLPRGRHGMIGRLSIIGQLGVFVLLLLPCNSCQWEGALTLAG